MKNLHVVDILLHSGSSPSPSFGFCSPLFDRVMMKVMTHLSLQLLGRLSLDMGEGIFVFGVLAFLRFFLVDPTLSFFAGSLSSLGVT